MSSTPLSDAIKAMNEMLVQMRVRQFAAKYQENPDGLSWVQFLSREMSGIPPEQQQYIADHWNEFTQVNTQENKS